VLSKAALFEVRRWCRYENTERRAKEVAEKGILYMGMGVSGGEEGARNGPAMMPGGTREAYQIIQDVVTPVSAQVDGGACVTYVGPGGAGNFVKMIHNGIEYGDMQLISEAYDILKNVGGLSNEELAETFTQWNEQELQSFLIEITSLVRQPPSQSVLVCLSHLAPLPRPYCSGVCGCTLHPRRRCVFSVYTRESPPGLRRRDTHARSDPIVFSLAAAKRANPDDEAWPGPPGYPPTG
jgi:hypothetical protein